jgi:ethanolaminephosphotransferase
VFLNFATLLLYDPTYLADKGGVVIPSWIYFSYVIDWYLSTRLSFLTRWAIGLFLYQSFDAIDG